MLVHRFPDLRPARPLVSVIIPVYNARQFLQRCLDSVFSQSMSDLEIIAVNDGSTDGSLRLLTRNAARDSRLTVIDQDNCGQGVARNRALDIARGEFVLFLDADDFIEPRTLELTCARALADDSDFVHFDWKLASRVRHRPRAYNYFNVRNIWRHRVLVGTDCDLLMDTVSFFAVTSLYRRSFLDRNGLRFGEGYIYEDNPFYVLAANRARRVSLIHSPLYVIQANPDSTTQQGHQSPRHAIGHVRAIRETLPRIEARSRRTLTYFTKYHLQKYIEYSAQRVPPSFRSEYSRAFLEAFSEVRVDLAPEVPVSRYLRLLVALRAGNGAGAAFFHVVITLRNLLAPAYHRRRHRVRVRRDRRRLPTKAAANSIVQQMEQASGALVFLGFDFRYAGNSRALFEQLRADPRFSDRPFRFVTSDERVPAANRVDPRNPNLIRRVVSAAAIVFLESWAPHGLVKHPDSIWIQLWHGTPLKRVLFDSHEPSITSARPEHKVVKHRDIQRWDFLLADSTEACERFATCFLFPLDRILLSGYPRVRQLLDQRGDETLRARIRSDLSIPSTHRVLLYAPTWRDRNYGRSPNEMDHTHLLDLTALGDLLGDEYIIVNHTHSYLSGADSSPARKRVIDASAHDIQDLLLIADAVISDYSSVVFDCFAADIPVALYCPDLEQFEAERGLYGEAWKDLARFTADSSSGIQQVLAQQPPHSSDPAFIARYAYRSSVNLLDFLDDLDLYALRRDW